MNILKYWTPNGFEVSSYKFKLNERVNATYNGSGSDNTGKCTYTYNELGFRGDSIHNEGFKVMSIGCSVTEGVGVNNNETWTSRFCQQIPTSVNLNFGYGGRSNDYISRCLLSYFDVIKPDLVLIMYTEPHRREFYTNDGGIEPFYYKKWGYFEETEQGLEEHQALLTINNKEENFNNWYKNHLLIKMFLELKKCNWLWNGWFLTNKYSDDKRFDGDFYPFIDYGVDGAHPGVNTHFEYSKKLFNYIKEKYPNYLPNV